jgi:hypothetical protein
MEPNPTGCQTVAGGRSPLDPNDHRKGLNNAIQGLIKKAYGYRNKERFKTDIFFYLGGLDLYPIQ